MKKTGSTENSILGEKLKRVIDTCFDEKIKTIQIPYFKTGVITSISSDDLTATININGEIRAVEFVKGSDVATGDVVRVLYDGSRSRRGVIIGGNGINDFSPSKKSFVCTPTSSDYTIHQQDCFIMSGLAYINCSIKSTSGTAFTNGSYYHGALSPIIPSQNTALSAIGYDGSTWKASASGYIDTDGKVYLCPHADSITYVRISGIFNI